MDLEKGKQIFFKYNGSRFHIDRECSSEYKKCKVPIEIEYLWLEEIKNNLLKSINIETGCVKISFINDYIQLLDENLAIEFLIKTLSQMNMDTFSLIILAETLKKYFSLNIREQLKDKIKNSLLLFKEEILSKKIEIDAQYKKLSYMKDYDFSDENIIKRINRI